MIPRVACVPKVPEKMSIVTVLGSIEISSCSPFLGCNMWHYWSTKGKLKCATFESFKRQCMTFKFSSPEIWYGNVVINGGASIYQNFWENDKKTPPLLSNIPWTWRMKQKQVLIIKSLRWLGSFFIIVYPNLSLPVYPPSSPTLIPILLRDIKKWRAIILKKQTQSKNGQKT